MWDAWEYEHTTSIVSQFILYFIRFQMNFDKFTMPKVATPQWMGTSCYRQVNSLIINSLIVNQIY